MLFQEFLINNPYTHNMEMEYFNYMIWCKCQISYTRLETFQNVIIEGQKHGVVAQQYSPITLLANDAFHKTSFAWWNIQDEILRII